MIDVALLNLVALKAGTSSCSVEARPGLRVFDIVREMGVEDQMVQLALVNGRIGRMDDLVQDGDRVVLSALVAGG